MKVSNDKAFQPVVLKKCKQCAGIFQTTKYKVKTGRGKYCSKKCVGLSQRLKPKICSICNKEFTPKSSLQKLCSNKCQTASFKKERVIKKCIYCECEYEVYYGAIGKQRKYCSRECFNKAISKARMGSGNPAYRHGLRSNGNKGERNEPIEYRKMKKNIKEKMINDKGYLYCERCGTSNSLQFEFHHLIFRSEAPKHKNLHNKRNIIFLCILCHNAFHKNKPIRESILIERKLWELFPNVPTLNRISHSRLHNGG